MCHLSLGMRPLALIPHLTQPLAKGLRKGRWPVWTQLPVPRLMDISL